MSSIVTNTAKALIFISGEEKLVRRRPMPDNIPKFNISDLDQIRDTFNKINDSYFIVDNAKDLIKMTNNEGT